MYTALLILHSWVRWAVLITGAYASIRALSAWLGKRDWTPADARHGMFFVIAVDTQFLIGMLLYGVFSPITRAAFQNMAVAMHVHMLRFYAVEHIMLGIMVVVAVHATRIASRRAESGARNRRSAIGFLIAMVLILATTPWPFLEIGRPLFRLGTN